MAVESTYVERPAPASSHPWSACLWVRRAPDSGLPVTATRVVPDGCVDLIWMRGRLQVAGPDTSHRLVAVEPGELIVGARLRPGAGRVLLGETPAAAVLDTRVDLDLLWGESASRLTERIVPGTDPWQVASHLAAALSARTGRHRPDPVAVAVAEALDRPRPPAVARLAWELGFSERQLRRRVVAATGYGPKTLEQILRFRRALAAAGPGTRWARVAAEQGYADQAHLARQVRRWSGAGPRELAHPA